MIPYMTVALLVRGVVELAEKLVPQIDKNDDYKRILAFILTGIAVFAYRINGLAQVNLASGVPLFDYALTTVVLGSIVLFGNDILKGLQNAKDKLAS